MQHVEQSDAGQNLMAPAGRNRTHVGEQGPDRRRAATAWHLAGIGAGSLVAVALLREASRSHGSRFDRLKVATAAVAGITVFDALYLLGWRRRKPRIVAMRASVTIRRPANEIYRFWRELRNLPTFMSRIDSVTEVDGHSVWRAWGPAGVRAEWEAEIVADRPNERIAWRSLEGATIPNRGSVEFREAPRGRGTEVRLEIVFEPPGGAIGAAFTRLLDEFPEQMMGSDLRRLKQLFETGEIVRSDASIHNGRHPARPPTYRVKPLLDAMERS
jgi:uncharacterized membrane protein